MKSNNSRPCHSVPDQIQATNCKASSQPKWGSKLKNQQMILLPHFPDVAATLFCCFAIVEKWRSVACDIFSVGFLSLLLLWLLLLQLEWSGKKCWLKQSLLPLRHFTFISLFVWIVVGKRTKNRIAAFKFHSTILSDVILLQIMLKMVYGSSTPFNSIQLIDTKRCIFATMDGFLWCCFIWALMLWRHL